MLRTPADPHLKLHCLWASLGWLLIAVVVYLSLTSSPLTLHLSHGDKVGHLLAYMALTLWFLQLERSRGRRLLYGGGFILMGVGLEFVQGYLGTRQFELADMAANTLGVLSGLLLGATPLQNLLARVERALLR